MAASSSSSTRGAVEPPRRPTSGSPCDPVPMPFLLAAMVRVLLDEGLVDLGDVAPYVDGLDRLGPALAAFGPDDVAEVTGVEAATIRRLARELAAAPSAAVYGRIGTTTAEFGTVASWLVDVLNICTGNLDRPAGRCSRRRQSPARTLTVRLVWVAACVPTIRGRGYATLPARSASCRPSASPRRSRHRGRARSGRSCASPATPCCRCPTAGASTPRSATLDLMVSVDIYRNETSRHADVILPAPSALEKPHYDVALLAAGRAQRRQLVRRRGAARRRPARRVGDPRSPRADRPGCRGRCRPGDRRRPRHRLTDRAPPSPTSTVRCTDATPTSCSPPSPRVPARRESSTSTCAVVRTATTSARTEGGLTLDDLIAAPHGIDLGPLQPRMPDGLRTPTGMIDVAPQPILDDLPRMERSLQRSADGFALDRTPRPALEQLVDAQRRGARQGQAALRAPRPSRRRLVGGPRRRRPGQGDAAGSARWSCRST